MKKSFFSHSRGLALLVAFSVGALGILGGCTRKQESSSITVAMPDWNQLTTKAERKNAGHTKQANKVGVLSTITVVSRVMINVSGPDIQNQIVYIWELNDNYQGNGTIPTPPAEHTLVVPRGSDRLIQVLAILEEIDTASTGGGGGGNMSFFYGETLKSIANAVEPVTIALVQESTASAGDGSISGRYIFSDGSTPTGPVDMYYAPIGRRPMIVERTSVFSGHFHFFLMPTVPFTFRMRSSGVPLFENVTTSSFTSRYSDRLLQISVPEGYRENGGGGTREFRTARTKVVGFTGPGANLVGRAACYPTPIVPLPDLYDAATGGSQIFWNPGSASSTEARVLGGGVGTPDGQCAAYTDFGVNSFPIYIDNLLNGDSPIGNRGPFRLFDLGAGGGNTFLDVSPYSGNLKIQWQYLAGVVGNSVDGVGIFYKVVPASESMEDRWHDNAPCNQLSSFGFSEITRVAAGNPVDPVVSYEWTTPNLTAHNAGRLKTVICPYANSRPGYYDFAISHYNRTSGGSVGPSATKIMVTSVTEPTVTSLPATPQHIAESTCTTLRIATTDATGAVARRAGGMGTTMVAVSVVGAPSGVRFYNDLTCSDPAPGLATITPFLFNDVTVIGMKADSSVTTFEVEVVDSTSGGTALPTTTHHMSRVSPMTATEILTIAKGDIKSWQCYPIAYLRGRVAGSTFIGEGGISDSLLVSGAPDLYFYLDRQCDVVDPSAYVPLAADQSAALRYFKYVGISATVNVTPDISPFTPLTQSAKILNVSLPVAPTALRYEIHSSLAVGGCHPFRLAAVNGQQEYSPVTVAQNLTYTFSSVPTGLSGVYTDSGCGAPAGSTITIPSGTTKSAVYFLRWDSSGPLTLHGSGTSISVGYSNLYINP